MACGVDRKKRGNPRPQYQTAAMNMVAAERIAKIGNGHNLLRLEGGIRLVSRVAEAPGGY